MDENKAASSKEGEENIGKEKKAKEYVGVISDVITRRKRFIKAESQCFDYSYSVIIEVLIEKDDEFIKDIITFERRDHTKGINEFRDFIIGSGAFQYNEIGKLEPDLEKLLGRTCIVELVEDKVKNTQIVDEDEVPIKRLDIDINGRKVYMINEINSKLHIKIEDIYISNSMLNKIIISLCSNITTQGDSAGFSDHITNVNKKKKRFLKSIGLSNDSICITLNGKKCYQLDTAAILIAYFLFPPRTKDSFPMKVMNGEFKDITGNQLLAFLDKASDVSRILILSAKYCYSNLDLSDDYYIVNVEKKIRKLSSVYKEVDHDNYNVNSFTNYCYDYNSDKFNELVMYANIKAQQEELIDDVSELVNGFLKEHITERNDRSQADDIFDALRPIDIPKGTNEVDVHTMICLYRDMVNDFSKKIIDATITMKKFVREKIYRDLFNEKADIFKIILKCFDELNDKGENVYKSIKRSCGEKYLDGLYEYVKKSCFSYSFENKDDDKG